MSECDRQLREFSEVYKAMPELWNSKLDCYKNKNVRRKSYQKLLIEFKKVKNDAAIDDMKKMLTNMRTCYRRELKKTLQSESSGAGVDDSYISPLWYFEELDFLRDLEIRVSGVTSISSDEEEEVSVPVQSLKKFKKGATERTEFLKKATEHLETSKKQLDEAEIYANAWACMYRQMKPEQQLFAKQAVDEVMLLGRFGKLCFNYLHSPSSSPNLSSPHVSRTSSPFLSNDSPLYISTSSGSPTESTSRFSHFTSLPTGSPIQAQVFLIC
ncbi:uncharacterized protein LOC120779628 [Bactrocera tryoni]|uniref:uncharacterized protein LOC120779628 n=1 Tax=Bactrocera tryoni TaxID=59916 RepID=UPI001A9637AE|nr:uncharacterized protein LOC120779628 [Bactrocera tryoni]